MRFRTLFLFVVLALTALFALVNWPAFTAPTTLSLGVGTITAPLGLIMLGVVFVLGAMCLAYLIYVQGTALMDSRRHARELQSHRELVDSAEASRYTELRDWVGAEMRKLEQLQVDLRQQMFTRLDQMEVRTQRAMQEANQSLTHTLVELEDRIEHRVPIGGTDTAHH
jgi:uncharacterized integral membrane protein